MKKMKKKIKNRMLLKVVTSVLLASSCVAVCGCAGSGSDNTKDTTVETSATVETTTATQPPTTTATQPPTTTASTEKETEGSGDEHDEMIKLGDVQLSVREAGSGPDMVLIHGRTLSKEEMKAVFNYYKKDYHVISYDVRGHGDTISSGSCTMEDLSDDLVGLIKEKNLYKPVVIGFSMGSYIALRTAERYPDLLSGLVLIGTRGKGSPNAYFADDQVSYAMDNFDNMTDISKVRIPALVVTGEYDSINPVAEGRKVSDALPDSEFLIVPFCGHSAHTDNQAMFFWKTDTFLKEVKRK